MGIMEDVDKEEIWAIIDCNTSTHAQDIMDRRIKRACLDIQATWSDRDRSKRAQYMARVDWVMPICHSPFGDTTKRKEMANGNHE